MESCFCSSFLMVGLWIAVCWLMTVNCRYWLRIRRFSLVFWLRERGRKWDLVASSCFYLYHVSVLLTPGNIKTKKALPPLYTYMFMVLVRFRIEIICVLVDGRVFNDLRLCMTFQLIPCLVIPVMAVLLPPKYTHSRFWLWATGF